MDSQDQESLSVARQALSLVRNETDSLRISLLTLTGRNYVHLGRFDDGIKVLQIVLAKKQSSVNHYSFVVAYMNMSLAMREMGNLKESKRASQAAIAGARDLHDTTLEAIALSQDAVREHSESNKDVAARNEAWALAMVSAGSIAELIIRNDRGAMYLADGNLLAAHDEFIRAREIAISYRNRNMQLRVESNLARLGGMQGHFDDSEKELKRILSLNPGDYLEVKTLSTLGLVYQLQGNNAAAEYAYASASRIADKMGMYVDQVALGMELAEVLGAEGKNREAEQLVEKALTQVGDLGIPSARTQCHLLLGNLLSGRGRYDEAIEAFRSAKEIAGASKDTVGVAIAEISIGEAFEKTGRLKDALQYLEEARSISKSVDALYAEDLDVLSVVYAEVRQCQAATQVRDEWRLLGVARAYRSRKRSRCPSVTS